MTDFKETQHGRNHRIGGSDEIPGLRGFIRYIFHNVGAWLDVVADWTTVSFTDLPNTTYNSRAAILFSSPGAADSWAPIVLQVTDGSDVAELAIASGISSLTGSDLWFYDLDTNLTAQIGAGDPANHAHMFNVKGTGRFVISSYNSGEVFIVDENTGDISIDPGAELKINLQSGQVLTVYDSSSNPVFRVDEDADIHIKTGKTILADL